MPKGTVTNAVIALEAFKDTSDDYFQLEMTVKGIDDGDADTDTNWAQVIGYHTITPIAALTKTIVDAAMDAFLLLSNGAGITWSEDIDQQIDVKQLIDPPAIDTETVDYSSLPS